MVEPIRIIDLIAAYFISLTVVGIFYFFGLIEDQALYGFMLKSVWALLTMTVLTIMMDGAISGCKGDHGFFQRHALTLTTNALSKFCILACLAPGAVAVVQCIILKIFVLDN